MLSKPFIKPAEPREAGAHGLLPGIIMIAVSSFLLYSLQMKTVDVDRPEPLASLATTAKYDRHSVVPATEKKNHEIANAGKGAKELARHLGNSSGAAPHGLASPSKESVEMRSLNERLATLEHLLISEVPPPGSEKPDSNIRSLPTQQPAGNPDDARGSFATDTSQLNTQMSALQGAVIHRNLTGQADYWLVGRRGEAASVRVIPLEKTQFGLAVHSVDEGQDYIITPLGEWLKYLR